MAKPAPLAPPRPDPDSVPLCTVVVSQAQRGNRAPYHIANDVISEMTHAVRDAIRTAPIGDITFAVTVSHK